MIDGDDVYALAGRPKPIGPKEVVSPKQRAAAVEHPPATGS